ncbi:MAG: ATP-binding protein [Sedimenticola sp.]|nr:ATP-binding protein [Sedimenticola sp.]
MKLRTQILLFFFAFALTPLLIAVVINLPLVLDRMELFYQKAHLQNLRADFRDLDQHLASRHEMVRLLAKLPEPGTMLGDREGAGSEQIDQARTRYIEWINQILAEQLDIVQISFLDQRGEVRFWLDRNRDTRRWEPTIVRPEESPGELMQTALQVEPGRVLVSALRLNPDAAADDPRQFMTLRLATPIHGPEQSRPQGVVLMNIDVGGIARFYRDTLWVGDNGRFLQMPGPETPSGNAFQRYPGLQELFEEQKPALWKGGHQQIMWVPMFRTERDQSLWVGRPVDPSPITEFRWALTLRVLSIVFLLMLATWLASRWLAKRAERLSRELIDGVQRILENEEPVRFDWQGPQELKRLGQNLSRLAEEHGRTARNLRLHAHELEASNRYKSQFLANISHELKTPLNSILLLSKLLANAKQGLNADQLKQARVIHEAGSDLQALIDSILDLSRIEARRTPLHPQAVALAPLLEGLVELVQPQFDAKRVGLRLEIDPAAAETINTDPEKLRQILKNFLSNAVKFTPEGEVLLQLQPVTPPARHSIRISVSDSGIGIPAEKHEEIFEAFKQADGATNRRYGGTGLGLTISRQLARLLGGDIQLQSEPGKGSRFSLLLPEEFQAQRSDDRPPQPASATKTATSPASEAPGESHYLGSHHLLVVDPNLQNLLRLTPLLEQAGLRVTAAADQSEAIEALADEPFDLVLVDITLPCEDCCDTIRAVKQHQHNLPVIGLLPEQDEITAEHCQTAGADAVIDKTIEPGALNSVLAEYLPTEDVATRP